MFFKFDILLVENIVETFFSLSTVIDFYLNNQLKEHEQ